MKIELPKDTIERALEDAGLPSLMRQALAVCSRNPRARNRVCGPSLWT